MSKPTPDSTSRTLWKILEDYGKIDHQDCTEACMEKEMEQHMVKELSHLLEEAQRRGEKTAIAKLRQSITRMSRFKDDHIELPIDWWDRKLADLDAQLTSGDKIK